MHHLTAVGSKEKHEYGARNNISPETGIFITHSPTKTVTKNNYYNKMSLNKKNIILLTMCMVSLYLPQQCTAEEKNVAIITTSPPEPKECSGVFLRYDCEIFEELRSCTVIMGSLIITRSTCNLRDLVFENLREITDFLFISTVKTLDTLEYMFPSLTVIRGRQVFTNYAIVINNVEDLEKLEFKSLIAIQRGHILMADCPKLCITEKINWDRITLSRGTNNLFLNESHECPEDNTQCIGCNTESCWSNYVCQRFESDSVITASQDPVRECHKQCLGGCYDRSERGCVVCKGYTDHGTCVKNCPRDKYAASRYLRCYTREECTDKSFYIHENQCVEFCPAGYKTNNITMECDLCVDKFECIKVCSSENDFDENIYIPDISTAQELRGCQIFNGSVVLDIYEFFDQKELTENLQDVREITGILKISRSPYLNSLDFFKNLEKIHGFVLENDRYAVVIYDNKNLTEFWNVKKGFEIVNGGMYIHGNDKVCNRNINKFRRSIKHDNSLDSIQKNDQEVFCSPAVLNLNVLVKSHRTILLYWLKEHTYSEVEIIYRSVSHKEQLEEKSEIDTNVCDRIKWNRELKFAHELKRHETYYVYSLENLEPNTRYAILVKTFHGDDDTKEARSEIKYATTQFDIPIEPEFILKEKTSDGFSIQFAERKLKSDGPRIVDYFILEVYHLPDNKNVLDTRDYCDEPVLDFTEHDDDEDFDECCSRLETEKRDQNFLSKLKQDFACSLDHGEYCQPVDKYLDIGKNGLFYTKRFEGWDSRFKIDDLQSFHLYVMQMRACNHVGCSSNSLISARTNYSTTSDNINFSFCKVTETSEYKVSFFEPENPNGYITSYAIHFRDHSSTDDNMPTDNKALYCVTRLEHERKNYVYAMKSNYTFDQAAIRVHSLGRHSFTGWKNITTCPGERQSPVLLKYFLYGLLIPIFVFVLWICHKRTRFSIVTFVSNILPAHTGWRFVRPEEYGIEDQQNMLHEIELVRLNNIEEQEILRPEERIEPE